MILSKTGLVRKVAVPAAGALALVAIAVGALLLWSAGRTDSVSIERQRQVAGVFGDKLPLDFAIMIEEVARFDDAVRQTHKAKLDMDWMDYTFGPFLNSLFGRSESFVLNGSDRAYYAQHVGKRVDPSYFAKRAPLIDPLLARLRRKMLNPAANIDYPKWKSPGIAEIHNVDGQPAIVVLKPIVSETGKIVQRPGTEHVFVFIYWLDKANLRHFWGKRYFLDDLRFSWTADHQRRETLLPVHALGTKSPVGYLIWRPYRPGSLVLDDIMLPLLAGLLVVCVVVWLLIRKIIGATAQLIASEAQAKRLAFHDTLTGLPNRALFEDRLERSLAKTRNERKHRFALLFLDLDRFKWVNDTLGHPAGDELIREVARRLTGLVAPHDTAARLGGDEFAIILNGASSKREINALCRRIQSALSLPFSLIGSQAFIGVSIGIARAPLDAIDRSELSRKADIALYHAKSAGRGRTMVFNRKMDATIQFRRRIERDLREGLKSGGQFEVHYQPQFDAATMAIKGVEALVRWNHPQFGALSPAAFVPIAEESGLIERLGEWVLQAACTAGRAWSDLIVSVNVSAVQLRNPQFAERVLKIAAHAGFDPRRLELEITETSLIESLEQCEANLVQLRANGVRIALDDFGTGYSSLSHLQNFRIDRVKIDRSFVSRLDDDAMGPAIIHAIVHLAHCTGVQITAEGVETPQQSAFLCAAGCNDLQGCGLADPLPLGALEKTYGLANRLREQSTLAA